MGDVIRLARKQQNWKQEDLGKAAAKFPLGRSAGPINKATVVKVEKDPFSSELATVWRLLATLNLSFADVEAQTKSPFHVSESPPAGRKIAAGQGRK